MFDLIIIAQMFICSAFLAVSACSCVRTSRVLFVLPMCEELQPGQINSYIYTTFDGLIAAFSLVLVKKQFCGLLFYLDAYVYIRVCETSPKPTFELLNKLCC